MGETIGSDANLSELIDYNKSHVDPGSHSDEVVKSYVKAGVPLNAFNIVANITHPDRFSCGGTHPGRVEDCVWGCNKVIDELKPLPLGKLRVETIDDQVAGIIRIEVTNPPTEEARQILLRVLPGLLERFLSKNVDYQDFDPTGDLGPKAHFLGIWRKVVKLRRGLWEGKPLEHEQVSELLDDAAGHIFLARLGLGE